MPYVLMRQKCVTPLDGFHFLGGGTQIYIDNQLINIGDTPEKWNFLKPKRNFSVT